MSVKCQAVIEAMDALAPRYLAENWDNVGLLVGSPTQDITNIVVAVDVTPELVVQAVEEGVDMIVVHHPLIFTPLTSLRTDLPQGKMLADLIKADIAVLAVHTNLDAALGGVNDVLANRLGIQASRPLSANESARLLKLVVFVPESHVAGVREAITTAGAGHIGNYSHCTFQVAGTGTFLPLAGTKPFIGEEGKLEYAPELRLETVLPAAISRKVVSAMLKAHPYEEVAYDLYEINNSNVFSGLGRIGELAEPVQLGKFAEQVKAKLNIDYTRVVGQDAASVKTVAVCGGSGGSLIRKAVEAGADVLVTGDIKYHEALEARELGLAVIDAGHFATESPVIDAVAAYLQDSAKRGGWSVSIKADVINKDVFHIF